MSETLLLPAHRGDRPPWFHFIDRVDEDGRTVMLRNRLHGRGRYYRIRGLRQLRSRKPALKSLPAWKRPQASARRGMPGCAIPRAETTREEWLEALTDLWRPRFVLIGVELPENIRMSCGFPKGRGDNTIGQCWSRVCSTDGACEIFISPKLDRSERVADVLIHELCHAVTPGSGHRKPFRDVAVAIGLEGKMTATTACKRLTRRLRRARRVIGLYPHAALNGGGTLQGGPKRQVNRMLKLECPGCGAVIRMARSWLEEPGPPICKCDEYSPHEFEVC